MCNAFSGIVERNLKTQWKLGVDSHSNIVELANLKDDKWPNPDFARFEIAPKNRDYRHPDKWEFVLDEQRKPGWWSPRHEAACWRAHKQWKTELYSILDTETEIVNPFTSKPPVEITGKHIQWLKEWSLVWYSVGNSVWGSVRYSVHNSVWHSVHKCALCTLPSPSV